MEMRRQFQLLTSNLVSPRLSDNPLIQHMLWMECRKDQEANNLALHSNIRNITCVFTQVVGWFGDRNRLRVRKGKTTILPDQSGVKTSSCHLLHLQGKPDKATCFSHPSHLSPHPAQSDSARTPQLPGCKDRCSPSHQRICCAQSRTPWQTSRTASARGCALLHYTHVPHLFFFLKFTQHSRSQGLSFLLPVCFLFRRVLSCKRYICQHALLCPCRPPSGSGCLTPCVA